MLGLDKKKIPCWILNQMENAEFTFQEKALDMLKNFVLRDAMPVYKDVLQSGGLASDIGATLALYFTICLLLVLILIIPIIINLLIIALIKLITLLKEGVGTMGPELEFCLWALMMHLTGA